MHKGFDPHRHGCANGANLVQRALARQHNALGTRIHQVTRGGGVGDSHLGGNVKGELMLLAKFNGRPIGNNSHIDVGTGCGDHLRQRGEFTFIHDAIQRKVNAHVPFTAAAAGFWQRGEREVARHHAPQVEMVQPQIDRIRACVQRGLQAGHVARRREEFGKTEIGWHGHPEKVN